MFLLKKVFQLRDKVNPDLEKPFLEHLEDLRVMITRIVITLLISMLVCFTFQEKLMEVLRRPVERVWMTQLQEKLPSKSDEGARPLDVDMWEEAKAVERAAAGLSPEQREVLYQSLGSEDLVFHAKSAGLLRAALVLDEEKREGFVKALDLPADLKTQVLTLMKTAPSPEIDNRGNLRLMSALKPTETFMLSMKLSFFAGIILSFPLLLMYILQFVLPGLHGNEKRVLWPSLAIGFGLFLSGVFFAYFLVLPKALGFFYEWSGKLGVSNDWRIGEYITFATQFTLLFGLSFELPVVVMVLVKLGILSYEIMSRTRNYAIVGIFVVAAILTPTPDIFTLNLMALPMILMYETCIWLAWLDARKQRREEEAETKARMERLLLGEEGDTHDFPVEPEPEPEPGTGGHENDFHGETDDVVETGDDGWDPEFPRMDPHVDLDAPPPEPGDPFADEYESPTAPPPDSLPAEEERRREEG